MEKLSRRKPVQEQLAEYPHSFQLMNQENIEITLVKSVEKSLKNALKAGYKTSIETARAKNLLAFLHHKLGRSQDGLTLLCEVMHMEDQRDNMVTLANRVVILTSEAEYTEAEELLATLQSLKAESQAAFSNICMKAKAEMAFSYSRFGPSFIDLAIETFNQVIPTASGPEVWLWKFGCALTRRRKLLLLHNSANLLPLEESLPEAKEILSQYLEIINNVECSTFRARVYAEIALLLDSMWESEKAVTEIDNVIGALTPVSACETALGLDNNDRSVLTKCSKVFRNAGKTEESVDLLRKSLGQRPSARGYHHLGLALIDLAGETKCGYQKCLDDHVGDNGSHCVSPSFHRFTSFSRDNALAMEALANLKLAVEYTEGQNTRAILDLAYLHRCFGDFEESKRTLLMLKGKEKLTNMLEKITMSDQLGSILLQMAEEEKDERRKARLQNDARTAQIQTLDMASHELANYPRFKVKVCELWLSFTALVEDLENGSGLPKDKMMIKSYLLQLTSQHEQSLGILNKIERMDPDIRKDPEFLKLCILGLVEIEQYQKALGVFDELKRNFSKDRINKLFDDDRFYLKMQIRAAKQALLTRTSNSEELFTSVYQEMTTSGVSCSENGYTNQGHNILTPNVVMLIYDDSTQSEAATLARILKRECGLQVFLEENVPSNKIEVNYMSDMVESSFVVAVLAGTVEPTGLFELYIAVAAVRPKKTKHTVTLLVESGRVPCALKGHRSRAFPSELLDIADNFEEREPLDIKKPMTESQASALCEIFCFLINLDVDGL